MHREEERAIPAHSTAADPNAGTGRGADLRLAGLPEFVTPDWLRENYHLMKADLRKLADAIGEDYPDWPATADGNDEAAFYRAVHDFAGRWTWFPWLFEERILTLFGRVKGRRKQLGPRVLKAATERARALRGGSPDGGEATILDDLDTLCEAGEYNWAVQSVWVLSCLEGPESRFMVSPWLAELEIGSLIGDAVHCTGLRPARADLVERLDWETAGAYLEKLAGRADEECAALHKELVDAWSRLRMHVSEHDDYRPAEGRLSFLLLDLQETADELDEMDRARNGALARCRHFELRSLLEGTLDAMPQTRFAEQANRLRRRVGSLLEESGLPVRFPDLEWESCRELAGSFRASIVEPGERELALREVSRSYAEDPSAENRDALHAAAAAEREDVHSTEPAMAVLDRIAASLGELVERFGSMADRDGAEDFPAGPEGEPPDPERALRAEIGELRAANREAEERIAALVQALGDAGEENSELRRQKHLMQQRLAALEGGESARAEDEAVPLLGSYVDLPAWAERHFEGRVALAGRALRAIKSAEFEDVGLVGKAIELLGGTYWRMKTGGGKALRDGFDNELHALRLQETPSLSPSGQGKARDDFSIEWNGRRLTLDRHLKNNVTTRDPRQCLRVYFAWDDATRQVVIGHLPGHMKI